MSLWIGEHVKLRRMAADDWRVLLEWAEDSEAQRIGGIVSGPQSEARMREHTTESPKQAAEDQSLWLMVTLLDGTPVGSVQTRDVNVRQRFRAGKPARWASRCGLRGVAASTHDCRHAFAGFRLRYASVLSRCRGTPRKGKRLVRLAASRRVGFAV